LVTLKVGKPYSQWSPNCSVAIKEYTFFFYTFTRFEKLPNSKTIIFNVGGFPHRGKYDNILVGHDSTCTFLLTIL